MKPLGFANNNLAYTQQDLKLNSNDLSNKYNPPINEHLRSINSLNPILERSNERSLYQERRRGVKRKEMEDEVEEIRESVKRIEVDFDRMNERLNVNTERSDDAVGQNGQLQEVTGVGVAANGEGAAAARPKPLSGTDDDKEDFRPYVGVPKEEHPILVEAENEEKAALQDVVDFAEKVRPGLKVSTYEDVENLLSPYIGASVMDTISSECQRGTLGVISDFAQCMFEVKALGRGELKGDTEFQKLLDAVDKTADMSQPNEIRSIKAWQTMDAMKCSDDLNAHKTASCIMKKGVEFAEEIESLCFKVSTGRSARKPYSDAMENTLRNGQALNIQCKTNSTECNTKRESIRNNCKKYGRSAPLMSNVPPKPSTTTSKPSGPRNSYFFGMRG